MGKVILLFIGLIVFNSCGKRYEIENNRAKTKLSIRKPEQVVEIYKDFFSSKGIYDNRDTTYIKIIKMGEGDTLMYLVNGFNKFCFISANPYYPKVIAYNERENLKMDTTNYGLMNWVKSMEYDPFDPKPDDTVPFEPNPLPEDPIGDDQEPSIYPYSTIFEIYKKSKIIVQPKITFPWYQGGNFELSVPHGKPLGCYPVAVAMVMKHYKYMKRTEKVDFSRIGVEEMDKDIDYRAEWLAYIRAKSVTIKEFLWWKFSATTIHDGIHWLHNWGYEASRTDYSKDKLCKELLVGRPVLIMANGGKVGTFNFWGKAHWFLCHGIKLDYYDRFYTTYYDNMTSETKLLGKSERYSYYINWGHGKCTGNGWYLDFHKKYNDGTYGMNYKYRKTMVRNIYPKINCNENI